MSALVPLFVYGSLMRGEVNHPLLAGCALLGRARTEARFELVDLGPYPGMVAGGRWSVAGEVYRAGADALVDLDTFEGHPGTFRRTAIRLADGRSAEAYLLAAVAARGRPRIAPMPEMGDVVRWRSADRGPSGS